MELTVFNILQREIGIFGFLILFYLTILWLAGLGPIGNRPLFFLGILLVMTATQLLGVGLIGELLQTTQLKESGKYVIRDLVGFTDLPESREEESDQQALASRRRAKG